MFLLPAEKVINRKKESAAMDIGKQEFLYAAAAALIRPLRFEKVINRITCRSVLPDIK